ncbi:MAG TPA: T9SS type A sorting domain-containing protein [Chitinophagaceae bacterium]
MKKILLSIAILSLIGYGNNLKAQCDLQFNNLVIQLVGAPQPYPNPVTGPNCKVVFNAKFDITTNSGFKYLFFHSWLSQHYPNPSIFTCGGQTPAVDPGTNVQLGTAVDDAGKSFLDIGFIGLKDFLAAVPLNTPTVITSLFATTYLHDNTVVLTKPSNSPGLTATVTKLAGSILHFEVQNILVILNQPCGGPVSVKTDIWGSNSNANDPKAQCYICSLQQFFNDPVIAGFKNCDRPDRKYTLGVTTVQPGIFPITIKIFADMDGDGIIDDDGDAIFNEPGEDIMVLAAPITHNLSIANPYSSGGPVAYPPYSSQPGVGDKDLLILVEGPTLANGVSKEFEQPQGCIGLPVDFKSFTAVRNQSVVVLKWETVIELNNDGFAIERNINGNWQQVAYISSHAQGGNSNDLLSYTFNDPNTIKGISQYRIRQVDQDGKFKYSVIRAVRGEGQLGKTIVFPNPSLDGKVTVVFEDAAVPRNVSVIDITGRVIRQWKGIVNNNLQIDNLAPGVFSIRIVVPETGEQVVERVVVTKR